MKAVTSIVKGASGLFTGRRLWYAVVAIIILVVVWRNWPRIRRTFAMDYGRDDAGSRPDNERKIQLENLARRLHAAMSGGNVSRL